MAPEAGLALRSIDNVRVRAGSNDSNQTFFSSNPFFAKKIELRQPIWTKAAKVLTSLLHNSFTDYWHLCIKRKPKLV
jgi:hypothetical protein